MARPLKQGFPVWNPHIHTIDLVNRYDKKKALKALRNSSSAFIARKDVRSFVFTRDNNKCVLCGGNDNLEVDHIISVYACIFGKIDIKNLNTEDNLQTLCKKCNCSKRP